MSTPNNRQVSGSVRSGSNPAFVRRFALLLLSSTLVLLLTGTAVASIDSEPQTLNTWVDGGWVDGELPDATVLLKRVSSADPAIAGEVIPALEALSEVDATLVDTLANGDVAVHLLTSVDQVELNLDAIQVAAETAMPEAEVVITGRAAVDRQLLQTINNNTLLAMIPVLIMIAILVTLAYGWKLGLSASAVVALSSGLGGVIGARAAGDFDGSLGSTALPVVLVSLLVSAVFAFRLLVWFKHPEGDNQADEIRRSVAHLLPDAVVLSAGLIVTAVFLEVLGAGRTPASGVAIGTVVATIVTLALFPAILATQPRVSALGEYGMFKLDIPDGRDLPLAVLAGLACFLLGLGLFASRIPSDQLLDEAALATGASAGSQQLMQLGGDPTSSIVVAVPAAVDEADLDLWAQSVSKIPNVGWVETATGRYAAGEPATTRAADDAFRNDEGFLVLVAPTVPARSVDAQAVVDMIGRVDGLGQEVVLSGVPVSAAADANDAATHLWLLVAALSIAGGIGVLVLVGDLTLAVVSTALRLLTSAALIGVYHLVTDSPSAIELHIAALVVAVGVGLFELGLLRRITTEVSTSPDPSAIVTDALRTEGRAALGGLALVVIAGLGFLASDLVMVRRMGIALAVGIILELLLATWTLRPVVLGDRAIRLLNSPTPTARGLIGARSSDKLGRIDPEWRRVVSGLLRAEFGFQTDPSHAELATVFVEGTPLFGELSAHNVRLRESGLRVAGEGPKLLKVKAVNDGSPVTLAITVDHPPRQLLDRDGKLLGVRPAERRDGMLWLSQDPSGRYRIAEAVDMGSTPGHGDSLEIKAGGAHTEASV